MSALRVSAAGRDRHRARASRAGGDTVAFYALTGDGATRLLEHFWVAPAHIGTGIGRRLFAHARERLAAEGVTALRGARRVGEVESTPAGRTLPLLILALP